MNDTSRQPSDAGNTGTEHRLILAGRVLNTAVFNLDGDHIGHIDDLSIERVTGKVQYAILSFGGFLGIGERFHPLPWSALHYDPGQFGFTVRLDKAALADAPHYTRSELAALGGDSHESFSVEILQYYGRYGVSPF